MDGHGQTGEGTRKIKWGRALLAGLAGGAAWIAAMMVLFGPAQAILADPAWQSEKFLDVMLRAEPPARSVEHPLILPFGLILIGVLYAVAFALIRPGLPGSSRLGKGLGFGFIAWLLAFSWFEFYLPWNVMREPAVLVALELVLWLGVMLAVGQTISWTYGQDRSRA